MAKGAGGGIPGNSLGQGFTRSSILTHLLGVSVAPTGTSDGYQPSAVLPSAVGA